MNEFPFSESLMNKRHRKGLLCIFVIWLFSFIYVVYVDDFVISAWTFKVWGILGLQLAVIIGIEFYLIRRSLRKMKVLIDEDKLVKQCGKKQQSMLWGDIAKVRLREDVNGILLNIKVYGKRRTNIFLWGFSEMEEMARLIKEEVSEGVLLQQKRHSLDWENPVYPIAIAGVTMMFMCLIFSMGIDVQTIFAICFSFAAGLLLLMSRLFTKTNLSFKWLDIIFGGAMIAVAIFGLIMYLLYF